MIGEHRLALFMMQAMVAIVVLAAAYVYWATARDLRALSQESNNGRVSLSCRVSLFAFGVVATSGAYAVADNLVRPALERVLGAPVATDVTTPSLFGQEIISTLLSLTVFSYLAGAVVARRALYHPMDGHWFLNPLSLILGLVAYIQIAANVLAYTPIWFYWGFSMKFLQVLCLPALGARAYQAGATLTSKPYGAA
jgi:hypothetical protein